MLKNNFKNLEIFLVGGALRDILLEIPPKELDFCINGGKYFNGKVIPLALTTP